MKVINPLKQSDVTIVRLHKFNGKVFSIRAILVELADQVPDNTFKIGYEEQKNRISVLNTDDIR